MTNPNDMRIVLVCTPGLETELCDEAKQHGFKGPKVFPGGVTIFGNWRDTWRANYVLRGATRVTAEIETFKADHLSLLEKHARKVDWGTMLRRDVPVRVDATCKTSKIYHSGAAAERVEHAIREQLGTPTSDDDLVTVRVRIERDTVTLSIDTSGELLHKRGHKQAVSKAPMRETLAALLLRRSGYSGNEPVLDPMCGSGTFVIEAAEIAAGLAPGRTRAFAFEKLATFDAAAWKLVRAKSDKPNAAPAFRCYGSDRDKGAIAMSASNAERAGVTAITNFATRAIGALSAPPGPPGLVITNPPYGERIGEKNQVRDLYAALGNRLKSGGFTGWRVAIITTDAKLAAATGLPLQPLGRPISHGGLRVTLFFAGPLP